MKRVVYSSALLLIAMIAMSGCGGNGGATGIPSAQLQARLNQSGLLVAWPYSNFIGNAIPGTSNCDPSSDSSCKVSFSNQADANGNFTLQTKAISPGEWNIGVRADSYCTTGAAQADLPVSAGNSYQFICGQITGTSLLLSPGSCSQTYDPDGNLIDDTCPATITATVTQPIFSTAHAMNVSDYDITGTDITSQSITATSSTEVVLPVPTQVGESVVVVRDPSNNNVVVGGLFTYTVTHEKCTPKTC